MSMPEPVRLRRFAPAEAMRAFATSTPDTLPASTHAGDSLDRAQPGDDLGARVARILAEVRDQGEAALRRWAVELGDRTPDEPLFLDRAVLDAARDGLPADTRALLERTATRISTFAEAQRACLRPLDLEVAGGRMGHELLPLDAVGCYAPGGRYPLPSSVVMTVAPARVAGVASVWVASPRPTEVTLAAAAIAGADGVLACGGAQALAALAYGVGPLPRVDFLCGPGNRWVTEAKRQLVGTVGIDMLAGPSELLVFADPTADPDEIAADLIGQAEHDDDARPILVVVEAAPGTPADGENAASLVAAVDEALTTRLADLPTAQTARTALDRQGCAVVCATLAEAVAVIDAVAPEHLEVRLAPAVRDAALPRLRHAGAVFLGPGGAEVLGDYGAGPNHVLPTGATARVRGGLSVLDFLRVRTFLDLPAGAETAALAEDAAALARLEGLEGHARAAELRVPRAG